MVRKSEVPESLFNNNLSFVGEVSPYGAIFIFIRYVLTNASDKYKYTHLPPLAGAQTLPPQRPRFYSARQHSVSKLAASLSVKHP